MQTILVIEDDNQTRKMLRQMLEGAGYNIVVAGHGKEGLKLFNEGPADLVITDIVMPEQEGIETIQELQKIAPQVKIIAISGGGRVGPEDYLSIAQMLGARQTLKKPVKREKLLASVREVLSES